LAPPSGHYDDRTDVALQNRTDHELSTHSQQAFDLMSLAMYNPRFSKSNIWSLTCMRS